MTESDHDVEGSREDRTDEYVRALERYRRRLDGAMFAGGLAWWEMDVRTGSVEFHENKADMLGFSPSDFEHYEDFTRLVHPDDHDGAMQAMRDHLEGRAEKYDTEYRIETKNDGYRWFHDIGGITERDDDGAPVKVTGVVVDITRRKETEERLRNRNDQLSLLNRIVRHDIRNDMNVIVGAVDMLGEGTTAEEREHREWIRRASEHALELTDNVGDLMELLEDGSPEVELHPVDLGRVIETEVERVTGSFPDVEIRTDGEVPPVPVEANGMLSSVVGNLLNNAVQHHDGESVTIDVTTEVREDTVVLRVADDGPGIPERDREAVFGRDVKGTDSEGTGLGLYLVATLVEAYGGEIRIADNDPRGTVFVVELVSAVEE